MSPAFATEGPERDIFLRALREYSEQCEPPQLTPGCPFRQVDPNIGPWCLDQCVDLLVLHDAPPPVAEARLGDLSIVRSRRPRSRRSLGPTQRAFDAREQYLADEGLPLSQRRAVSLLYGLSLRLSTPRVLKRDAEEAAHVDLDGTLDELGRRGYDAELLIREGMSYDIANAILWSVLIPRVARNEGKEIDADPVVAHWDAILVDRPCGDAFEVRSVVLRQGRAVVDWVLTAPLPDVLAWRAPAQQKIQGLQSGPPAQGPHRWLVDRLLRTYLADWETMSLKLEWQYQHGRVMPPCPATEMSTRNVDQKDLARTLADRLALDSPKSRTPLHRFVPIAVELLREGKRQSAAAIFSAIVEAEPQHAQAQNHYGFCLLPDDPQRALFALQKASENGKGPLLTANVGNRILAFALLGRLTPALDLAERFYEENAGTRVPGGWMWKPDFTGKEPVLLDVDDMGRYILDLAVQVAEASGDNQLVELWRERRKDHFDRTQP